MNRKDLYFAVADIDEKWIEESEAKEKKHTPWKYIVPIAACLAIAVAVAGIYNRAGKNVPLQPENSENVTNNGYIVTERTTDKQKEPETEFTEKTETDSKKTDVQKIETGEITTENGNGFCIPAGETYDSIEYKKVIKKADKGIASGAASVVSAKAGEVFLSPGLSETIKNHIGENVYYRVVIEPSANGMPVYSQEELEKEADRLYKWCQENGYADCTFSVSRHTYNDGQQSEPELYGDFVTDKLIRNFPADNYGYWIRFENELL